MIQNTLNKEIGDDIKGGEQKSKRRGEEGIYVWGCEKNRRREGR